MGSCQRIAVLLCVFIGTLVISAPDAREVAVVRGNNDFALQLYQVQAREAGNVFLSPISAMMSLGMLSLGAEGATFSQLVNGLHLPKNKDVITHGAQSLLNSIRKAGKGNNTLVIANRIYSDFRFTFKKAYTHSVTKYFHSKLETVDFMDNPEQSRMTINKWVEEETKDKVKDLLPQDVITTDTKLVLVNAMYFKGTWSIKFKKDKTRSEPFYISCKDSVNVDMMHANDRFKYADFPEYQAIQLDYQGEDINMLILLPKSCDDGREVERVLDNVNLTEIQTSLRRTNVRLSLPRFTLEQTTEMNENLKALGMVDIFTSSANLSGISDQPLQVSTVIQKTFVDVSEEGTEAAASTGSVIVGRSIPVYRPFTANMPFLFLIREAETKTILFIGKFTGP